MRHSIFAVVLTALMVCAAVQAAPGAGALALLCAENNSPGCFGAQANLQATNKFTSVDAFDVTTSTPALSTISGYGAVLAWTDNVPADPTGLGNLLASYYNLGGKHLVVSTYGFSNPWAISGTVMTGSFAALTNLGTNGTVSGSLVAVVPSDPIFTGTTLSSVTYFENLNYAHPGLAPGATLLATDGAGVNMIARSANGVIDFNVYPGSESATNAAFYNLLATALTSGGSVVSVPALTPVAVVLLIAGILLLAAFQLRRRTA